VTSLSSIGSVLVRAVVFLGLVIGRSTSLIEWRMGRRTLRDARGRSEPVVALALVAGGLVAAGALVSLAS
jgi:hypothetical protein